MTRRVRIALATGVVVALTAACGPSTTGQAVATSPVPGGAPARATSAPTAAGAVLQPISSALPIGADEVRLVRRGTTDLVLQVELRNGSNAPVALDQLGFDAREQLAVLADLPRRTGYAPLSAAGSDARVGLSTDTLATGDTATLTAVFPAPPPETTSMLVVLDGLLPATVPITSDAGGLTADPVLQATPTDGDPAERIGPLVCTTGPGTTVGKVAAPTSITLPGDVTFAFGKADLTPAATAAIEQITAGIKDGTGQIAVAGHTDSVGGDADNQALSERRAASVATALERAVGGGYTITTQGFGETRPVAPNAHSDGSDDPDGRARNRRVELTVTRAAAPAADAPEPGRQPAEPVDAALRLSPGTVVRSGGLALATVTVTNTSSSDAPFEVVNHLDPKQVGPGEVGVVDKAGAQHDACAFTPPRYFDFLGTLSDRFGGDLGVVAAGATVTVWSLVDAAALDGPSAAVRVAGFTEPVTVPVSGS